jgi:hypothetical protein
MSNNSERNSQNRAEKPAKAPSGKVNASVECSIAYEKPCLWDLSVSMADISFSVMPGMSRYDVMEFMLKEEVFFDWQPDMLNNKAIEKINMMIFIGFSTI